MGFVLCSISLSVNVLLWLSVRSLGIPDAGSHTVRISEAIGGSPIEDSVCELVFIRFLGDENLSAVSAVKEAPTGSILTIVSLSLCTSRAGAGAWRRTLLFLRLGSSPSVTRNTTTPKSQNARKGILIERSRSIGGDPCETLRNRCSAPRVGIRTTCVATCVRGVKQ